jgi:hypothetical protein
MARRVGLHISMGCPAVPSTRTAPLGSRVAARTRLTQFLPCGLALLFLGFAMWAASGVAYACDPATGQGCDMNPPASQPPASQPTNSTPSASQPPASSPPASQPPGESFIPPGSSTRPTPSSPPGEAFVPPGAATGAPSVVQPVVTVAAQPPVGDATPAAVTPPTADTSTSGGGSGRPWWGPIGGGAALCGAAAAAGEMTSDTKKKVGTGAFGVVGVLGLFTSGPPGWIMIGVGVLGEVAIWGFGALDGKSASTSAAPAPVKEYRPKVAEQHYKNLDDAEIPTQPKSEAPDPNTAEDLTR